MDGLSISGKVGVSCAPSVFVKLARDCTHQLDFTVKVPCRVAKSILKMATEGKCNIEDESKRMLNHYYRVMQSSSYQEQILRSKLSPDVEKVVHNKKIFLFKRMLPDIGYDEMAVEDVLVQGVKIVGEGVATAILPADTSKMPTCSIRHLCASAVDAEDKACYSRTTYDPAMDEEVCRLTAQEAKDWLRWAITEG